MAITGVLALFALMFSLTDDIPMVAYATGMDYYYLICIVFVSLNMIEVTVVNYFNTKLGELDEKIAQRFDDEVRAVTVVFMLGITRALVVRVESAYRWTCPVLFFFINVIWFSVMMRMVAVGIAIIVATLVPVIACWRTRMPPTMDNNTTVPARDADVAGDGPPRTQRAAAQLHGRDISSWYK
eukprot:gene56650-biopygen3834